MTNNNNHHSNALAFPRQFHTNIVHQFPTPGPVPAVQRVDSEDPLSCLASARLMPKPASRALSLVNLSHLQGSGG
jgi:hypothetical protein